MVEWEGYRDPRLGLPVYSLYGEVRKPQPHWLDPVDVMLCDLVDVGARYYTFLWTATLVLEACAERGIPLVVLDRPNPLNGVDLEGPLLDLSYTSFVGRDALPMRHGMTIGELLTMYNDTHQAGCDLHVMRVEGWRRADFLDESGVAWAMPSPNMPTLDTAVVYPGMCLLEGTELSEGRGTTRPFEIVGAPYIDAHSLAAALHAEGLPGACWRPLYFEPTFQKHARRTCGGVFLHVTDRRAFRSVAAATAVLHHVRRLYPDFAWKQPPYEYETERMPIDILAGSDAYRRALEAGTSPRSMVSSWSADLARFTRQREKFLLY